MLKYQEQFCLQSYEKRSYHKVVDFIFVNIHDDTIALLTWGGGNKFQVLRRWLQDRMSAVTTMTYLSTKVPGIPAYRTATFYKNCVRFGFFKFVYSLAIP